MFNREHALSRALRVALAEKRLLELQVLALRDPDAFQWAFIQVDTLIRRLRDGPRLDDVDTQG